MTSILIIPEIDILITIIGYAGVDGWKLGATCKDLNEVVSKNEEKFVVEFKSANSYGFHLFGVPHCLNGPALTFVSPTGDPYHIPLFQWDDGTYESVWADTWVEYRVKGRLHRTDGPARICEDESVEYYLDGLLHREGGPAMIINPGMELDDGRVEYFYEHGVFMEVDDAE